MRFIKKQDEEKRVIFTQGKKLDVKYKIRVVFTKK